MWLLLMMSWEFEIHVRKLRVLSNQHPKFYNVIMLLLRHAKRTFYCTIKYHTSEPFLFQSYIPYYRELTILAKNSTVLGSLVVRVNRVCKCVGGYSHLYLFHRCVRLSTRRDTGNTMAHLNGRWYSPISSCRTAA